MSHTPTPWVYYEGDGYIRTEDTGGTVARVCDDDGHVNPRYREDMPTASNGLFIVRAVNSHADLLAACEVLLGVAERGIAHPSDSQGVDRVFASARAAIAKAKGEA